MKNINFVNIDKRFFKSWFKVFSVILTNSKEMKELLGYKSRHHEDLERSFSDEQREVFEKFHDCWSEYMSLAEASIFEYAFKLGMQITIETLTDK